MLLSALLQPWSLSLSAFQLLIAGYDAGAHTMVRGVFRFCYLQLVRSLFGGPKPAGGVLVHSASSFWLVQC
jgi:hypothetical protein